MDALTFVVIHVEFLLKLKFIIDIRHQDRILNIIHYEAICSMDYNAVNISYFMHGRL
jgi:hypothetical protein